MNPEPEHVDRRLEQLGVDPVPEQRRGLIRLDQVPKTVDDQRRVRLVRLEQPAERLPQRPHHLPVEGLFEVRRSEAAGEQQTVALSDRQVEVWARWTRSWRLGRERPVSTKLTCLLETFASNANSICVNAAGCARSG